MIDPETAARARAILKAAGIPYGQTPPRQPVCECGRDPLDCDTRYVLGYIHEPDRMSDEP